MGIKYLYDTYSYQDMIDKFYKKDKDNDNDFLTLEVTFQITEDCNLNCSYCYQKNKTPKKMNFETAKIIVDNILDDDSILNKYTDLKKYVAVSLEFIGGEPLLEIELIQQICEYFIEQAIAKHHRFALNFMINMTSNGLLYFKPEVQEFLNKFGNHVYISISLDGGECLIAFSIIFPLITTLCGLSFAIVGINIPPHLTFLIILSLIFLL